MFLNVIMQNGSRGYKPTSTAPVKREAAKTDCRRLKNTPGYNTMTWVKVYFA